MGLSNEMMVVIAVLAVGIIFLYYFCRDIQYPWKQHGNCGDLLGEVLEAGRVLDDMLVPEEGRILWPDSIVEHPEYKKYQAGLNKKLRDRMDNMMLGLGEDKDLDAARIREKPVGELSDGYHTFDELYEHRHMLFIALMISGAGYSWRSRKHDDGTEMEGWFVAGIKLAGVGMITYHLPNRLWDLTGGSVALNRAPKWDGHTSDDVLERLRNYIERPATFPPGGGHDKKAPRRFAGFGDG